MEAVSTLVLAIETCLVAGQVYNICSLEARSYAARGVCHDWLTPLLIRNCKATSSLPTLSVGLGRPWLLLACTALADRNKRWRRNDKLPSTDRR